MIWGKRRADRNSALGGAGAERAIIDIGSNTVRLVVYGGTMRAPTVLMNEKVTAKLGREIAATGRLSDEAMALALRGLRRFALLLADMGIKDIETVATAAVRDAANGPEFVAELRAIGLDPRVISGEEEALLSAHGVIGAFPDAHGIVADLGGGSLELVRVAGGACEGASSLPLGTLRLPEHRGKNRSDMKKSLDKAIRKGGWDLAANPPAENGALYLVGGTWRAMAVYAMAARGWPLSDPHGFELDAAGAQELAAALSASDSDALKTRERISTMRAEKLPDAAVLLQALLARLAPARVVFSSWGLREGLLYDRLPAHTRAADPLLAGVAVFAGQRGTQPQLAARMAAWTLDAAPARDHGSERLRLAATMLALASMQIEPNIRLPQAINWALHKRWIGIDGKGRAMLAAAVAANGNQLAVPDEVRALASEEALEEAVRWGLALRLARRLGAQSARSLEVSRLRVEQGMLVLELAASHAALFGAPTEKDIKLLAARLGLGWRVDIVEELVL
ncbi:Ppx/GppA family phosphatase [Erythrobacter donghaensis]|jgi:exopolyphosphatase/guanosine-5'-triphosphate,3'-diphosphate pyrophosphatase|uniref:Ppx/GppA family phosphatase n=1 Tax=Erythrobacter donghaensis TaxID=267135 RepID=UPI00093BB793|nr:Ppx/GppA family phosphatase [Erythrobacter donghaensis]